MKIKLVGHSSIIIRTATTGILCDPWFSGRVFNEGWGLAPEPRFAVSDLAGIEYLWISHEHPDHLHFPTLSSFPQEFKASVTVLFQENNSQKVPAALAKSGFRRFIAAKHGHLLPLGKGGTFCAVYQHRHLDSALIVRDATGLQVINANDAELTRSDCGILRRRFGAFDVLFSQFSIAGFDGIVANVAAERQRILQAMCERHVWLGARVTVPIASFMYFCRPDNNHLNEHANSALDVQRAFADKGLACHLMYPGNERDVPDIQSSAGDIEQFRNFYATWPRTIDPLEKHVPLEKISAAFQKTVAAWHKAFPSMLVNRIGTIVAKCADHGTTYELDFRHGTVTASSREPMLEINSQPLWFAFSVPFGVQTLGVSGRYRLARLTTQWKLVRVLSSLFNAEIYLRPRQLFSTNLLRWIIARRAGLLATLRQQLIRFSR
jgi:UDP-MurNAc hydroxylase